MQVKMSVSFNFINLNVGVLGPIPFMWDVLLLYTKEGGEITLELLLDKQIYYTTSIGIYLFICNVYIDISYFHFCVDIATKH